MGISQATELGEQVFLHRLDKALSSGLRMLMLREKSWESTRLDSYAREVLELCRQYGAQCVLNVAPDFAERVGSDGVHLTSARLMQCSARPDLKWCGASCHNAAELEQAERLGLDYVVLGPVMPTRSHPEAQVLGWQRFQALITNYSLPVYALGGLSAADLHDAWQQGAHGVAMMRACWVPQDGFDAEESGSGSSSSGTR